MEECGEKGGQEKISIFGVGLHCTEVQFCLVIGGIFFSSLEPGRQINSFC